MSLMYQIEDDFKLKISHQCCYKLKKEPMAKYERQSKRYIAITGMTKEEGGQRRNLSCIITDSKTGNVKRFHPLSVITQENVEWVDWYIAERNIELCELYYAILDENIRKCFDYCDMLPPPPEVQQRVYPPNIKNILVEYENYKPERVIIEKADPFKPTDLKEFANV